MSAQLSPATLCAVARAVTQSGRTVRFAMRGVSMLPLLYAPLVIDVGPAPARCEIGDIIVFAHGEIQVAHRVVGYRGERYLTSGDAQPRRVESVARCDVVGRVEAVWTNASASAQRIDGRVFNLRGILLARTHGPRRVLAVARGAARAALRRTFRLIHQARSVG